MARRSAHSKRILAAGLSGFLLLGATGQAAAACATPAERLALNARVLQSELMVAALSCGKNADYNAFVKKFQPQLVERGKSLRQFFVRLYGAKGETRLNAFVTRMANEASVRSLRQGGGYCDQAGALFSAALAMKASSLLTLISQTRFTQQHDYNVCTEQASAESAERVQ
ncbi:MAG: hypothetical protein OQJ99_09960 [Rhodospirillales bacterium]|nr:hypothetical protein [Rhodospirillales bacterium]MCW8970382.1 hypothetical protein [Rhodospirillales bacterium]MCW9001457.1 hypothetical protein [Rhodospirillales bacterium]MCW9040314.1 hypothetical protein [Rhodospirillales bacterium]